MEVQVYILYTILYINIIVSYWESSPSDRNAGRWTLDSKWSFKAHPNRGAAMDMTGKELQRKGDSTCISTSSLRGNWTMLVVTLCSYVFVGVFYSVPTCQRSPACSFRTHPKTDPGVPKYPTTHGSHASQTDPTKTTVGTKHLLCLPAADWGSRPWWTCYAPGGRKRHKQPDRDYCGKCRIDVNHGPPESNL